MPSMLKGGNDTSAPREALFFATRLAARAFLAVLSFSLAACSKPHDSIAPAERHFQVRGIVKSAPDLAAKSLTIEHEDIAGFMPSMTMPFEFKDPQPAADFKPGDGIAFQLVVGEKSAWMIELRHIDAAGVHLPAASSSAPVAGKIERLKEGDPLPDFALLDQAGRALQRDTFAGKSLLVTFIFTRCPIPNFCPLITDNFLHLQRAIQADPALKGRVNLLSISFDPLDTPAVLAAYGARFSNDLNAWRFATGSPAQIQNLTRAFAVQVQPEGVLINHGLTTALIGPTGIVEKLWRGNGWQTAEVLEALRAR